MFFEDSESTYKSQGDERHERRLHENARAGAF